MSDDQNTYIHQLTLECMMNRQQYEKYMNSKETSMLKKKDQKFYRKRILALTRDLLYETDPSANILPDIKHTFQNYVKTCVEYFKSQDKSDILQEDYLEILEKSLTDNGTHSDFDTVETSKVMMRSIQFKENTLEKFVKRIENKPEQEPILPKKRSVNLKDPILKDKGIRKNKNITTNYEDNKNNETSIKKEDEKKKTKTRPTEKNDETEITNKKTKNTKTATVQPKDESK
jgi:hypothetical protein